MNSRQFVTGLALGLVTPIFGMICWFVLYFERKGLTWDQYVGAFESKGMLRTRILSLGLIFMLPLFLYFYNRNNLDAMRGIVLALFVYALIIVILLV